MTTPPPLPPLAIWHKDNERLILEVSGDWRRDGPLVTVTGSPPDRFPDQYRLEALGTYDSTLPAFLLAQIRSVLPAPEPAENRPSLEGLPANLRGLLELALAVPEASETRASTESSS